MLIWKTMRELQQHAIFDCPKFGCDICYQEEFQHMTRAELFHHIKRECPEVMVQCQVCNRDYNRAEFSKHECLKDHYHKLLSNSSFDVFDYLAENLMMLRRSKALLGTCLNFECQQQYKESSQYKQGIGMMTPNPSKQPTSCYRCHTMVTGFEDCFNCIYCQSPYCPSCLGYTKFF